MCSWLPSVNEGSPLIVLETMAASVPVVVSAVGSIPDQVRHGKEGLLVPPGAPGVLGDTLLRLLRDPPTPVLWARRAGTGRPPSLATRPCCRGSSPSTVPRSASLLHRA